MTAAQATENHGDEWGLAYFLWGIHTSIPTWTQSQNSLAAAEAPSLNICSHGISLPFLSAQNRLKWHDERGHPVLSLFESQWKQQDRISQ